jgi:AcrR family transcriptional regulator
LEEQQMATIGAADLDRPFGDQQAETGAPGRGEAHIAAIGPSSYQGSLSHKKTPEETDESAARHRRLPRQSRGLMTLNSILDAAYGLFVSYGYENVTTNRIADRAGVSIGSLYQYFADKDSIAEALVERASLQLKRELENYIRSNANMSMEEEGFRLIWIYVGFYERNQFILLELVDQCPQLYRLMDVLCPENMVLVSMSHYIEKHWDRFTDPVGVRDSLFVLSRTVFPTIRSWLRDPHPVMSRDELVKCLANLCIMYVTHERVDYAKQYCLPTGNASASAD